MSSAWMLVCLPTIHLCSPTAEEGLSAKLPFSAEKTGRSFSRLQASQASPGTILDLSSRSKDPRSCPSKSGIPARLRLPLPFWICMFSLMLSLPVAVLCGVAMAAAAAGCLCSACARERLLMGRVSDCGHVTCSSPPSDISRRPKHPKILQRAQRVHLPRLHVHAGPAQPGGPGRPRQGGVRAPEQAAQAPRPGLLPAAPPAAAAAAEAGCGRSLTAAARR